MTGEITRIDITGLGGIVNYWTLSGGILENNSGDTLKFNADVLSDHYLEMVTNTFFGIEVAGAGNLSYSGGAPHGMNNTGFGYQTLYENTTGYWNTAVGTAALRSVTEGLGNTAIGYVSGAGITTGIYNTLIGDNTGYAVGTGSNNIFIGSGAGVAATNVTSTIGIGVGALRFITGTQNVAMGYLAMALGTGDATQNVSLGYDAGLRMTNGDYNVLTGSMAGDSITTGYNNVVIGRNSGGKITTGYGNIFIGTSAGFGETGSNKLYIDNDEDKTPLIYGDFALDSIVINGDLTVKSIDSLPQTYALYYNKGTGEITYDSAGTSTGSNYWEILSGDTIDTKDFNVKLDSSFIMDYGDFHIGYSDWMDMGSSQLGFIKQDEDTLSGSLYFNDAGIWTLFNGTRIVDTISSINIIHNSVLISSDDFNTLSSIEIKPNNIRIWSDSLSIDSLPRGVKGHLLTWDSATHRVFAMDTAGWGGGGMGGDSYWDKTGNFLYPKTLTDSIGIGTDNLTEKLDVDGFVKFYNSDSGYVYIYLSDTTTDYIVSYRANGMYISNLGGVRLNGGCIDSLRYSTVWAEGESVGMSANYSSTSYGGIYFNGGYETNWFVHEGNTYGGVSVDTNSFHSVASYKSLNLGDSLNPWVQTFTDFLRLIPRSLAPSPASEGMIYSDTDHHIYYYNGSTWVQLDN